MPRKKSYQYKENDDFEEIVVSRSQKKRDSTKAQEIGEELVKLAPGHLAHLPLTEDLKSAISEYKKSSNKEAKRRLLQYVGRLMREAVEEAKINGTEDIIQAYSEYKKNNL